MKCFYCGSDNKVKAGFIKGHQRYKCKECGSFFTVVQKSTAVNKAVKRMAVQMYLEGLGFNAIGKILGVSHTAVLKWMKKLGKEVQEIISKKQIEIVELDEMHSYIGSKKTISGLGLLLIDAGKDSSTSFWVKGTGQHAGNFGQKLKTKT